MGLSNEERLTGIYWSLYRIDKVLETWSWQREREDYISREVDRVFDLVGQLWPAFIGKMSNGMHWAIGSDTSSTLRDGPDTPWAVAVSLHCGKAYDELHEGIRAWRDPDYQKPFDALKHTSIQYLVSHHGENAKGYIFEIYQEMEQIVYYLRRYDDDFLKKYSFLSDLVAKIMGACFTIFSDHEGFGKAYVIHQMMEIMYGSKYPHQEENWDIATQILVKHMIHHDFIRLMDHNVELKDLAAHHIEMVKAKVAAMHRFEGQDWSQDIDLLRIRVTTALQLGHSVHEYAHIRKEVLQQIADSPLAGEINTFKALLEKKAEEFAVKKAAKDSDSSDDYHTKELDAYGFSAGSEMYDFMKELKAEVPIPDPAPAPKPKKDKKKKKVKKNESKAV